MKKYRYIKELKISRESLKEERNNLIRQGYRIREDKEDYVMMYKRGKFPWLSYLLFMPVWGWILIPFRLKLYDYYVKIEIDD